MENLWLKKVIWLDYTCKSSIQKGQRIKKKIKDVNIALNFLLGEMHIPSVDDNTPEKISMHRSPTKNIPS